MEMRVQSSVTHIYTHRKDCVQVNIDRHKGTPKKRFWVGKKFYTVTVRIIDCSYICICTYLDMRDVLLIISWLIWWATVTLYVYISIASKIWNEHIVLMWFESKSNNSHFITKQGNKFLNWKTFLQEPCEVWWVTALCAWTALVPALPGTLCIPLERQR